MAIRIIRTDEDPLLRKTSREVVEINGRIKSLVEDMNETMYAADGVGLAAPQVGILRRVVVVDDRDGNAYTLINPKIIEKDGFQDGNEACLSVPSRQGKVRRYNNVKVDFLDIEGNEQTIEAEGFFARILEHELDHLDGILYTDIAEAVVDVTVEMEEV